MLFNIPFKVSNISLKVAVSKKSFNGSGRYYWDPVKCTHYVGVQGSGYNTKGEVF